MNSLVSLKKRRRIDERCIIEFDQPILITGSNGFIGSRVVRTLLDRGFTKLRCFVRPSSNQNRLAAVLKSHPAADVKLFSGNLLSREDCAEAAEGVAVIYHLAAGIEKTFPGSFMNSVVTTRNLLDIAVHSGSLRRFVNVSSFAVYSNWGMKRGGLLDETTDLESKPTERGEAYAFAKLKQDQIVREYGKKHNLPCVTVRPGAVYGPGLPHITARVGIDTFGVFLHLGGANQIPLTYVDNCADAIVLAGLRSGIDGEVFNIVDDDLPTSRTFLRLYKKHGKHFNSLYVPYWLFYGLCWAWERYSHWSEGQLPLAFNRRRCATYWKGNRYSNEKLKTVVGWQPSISFKEGSQRYLEYVRGIS